MFTSFSWKQIEDCIIILIDLQVEQVKEGTPDAFVGVNQYAR